MNMKEQVRTDLKNPWLRGIIAAVVVTVGVNVVFIAYAFMSPPNLVVRDYYEKGKRYFHEEALREQAAVDGWRLQLLPPATPKAGKLQPWRLYAMDHQGRPLRTGQVTLFAYRPSDASYDFRVDMPYTDIGTFMREISFPLPGHWDLIAQIRSGERSYDVAKRIFVAD